MGGAAEYSHPVEHFDPNQEAGESSEESEFKDPEESKFLVDNESVNTDDVKRAGVEVGDVEVVPGVSKVVSGSFELDLLVFDPSEVEDPYVNES